MRVVPAKSTAATSIRTKGSRKPRTKEELRAIIKELALQKMNEDQKSIATSGNVCLAPRNRDNSEPDEITYITDATNLENLIDEFDIDED